MTYSDEVLADTPLGFWKFDEASAATLTDSSGNAHDGTWTGTPGLGAAPLVYAEGTSTLFDGDDYATIPLGTTWMPTAAFTYEVVVNPSAAPDGSLDILTQADPPMEFYRKSTGEFQLWVKPGGTSVVTTGGTIPLGATSHLAATYDGTTVRLYVNGAEVASQAATGALGTPTTPYMVGRFDGETYFWFRGQMSHVAVYGTALSPARVGAHADAILAPVAPVGTSTAYANQSGYNYTGRGEVTYDPPIAPTPAHIRRAKIMRVHQSIPAPTLVDGRPV